MRRSLARAMFFKVLAIAFLMILTAYGQSLGEIARKNREKQKAEDASSSTATPKVITNKDLPKDLEEQGPQLSVNDGSQSIANRRKADHVAEQHFERQRLVEQRAANQWKRQIMEQKSKMANLQARIDQLNASIRLENGSTQYEGPNGRGQARQMGLVAQAQLQLNEQQRKLTQMQEAARRAGMHTVVYDP
jgi:hypothetical protein